MLLGMRNLNFAGVRKTSAFRYSWHRQQGSRQDSLPGITKSGLEMTLATLEGLPSTAGRSLLECKVTGNPQGSAHQGHEREVSGLPVKLHSIPQMAQISVQTVPTYVLQGCGDLWGWKPHCHLFV